MNPQNINNVLQVKTDLEAVKHLRVAIAVKIGLGAVGMFFTLFLDSVSKIKWRDVVLAITPPVASFVIYNLPYGLLLLARKLEELVLAFAFTFPAIFLLIDLVSIFVGRMAMNIPANFLFIMVTSAVPQFAIFMLALRVKEHLGPDAGARLTSAALLSVIYLGAGVAIIPLLRDMLYRVLW